MGGTALERLLSDPSAALWDPLPRDLVAELTYYVWSAEHPAPEAVAYLWCWRQARDGRRPSIRDLAEFAGRGKTWAARLRQRVLVDFDSWTDGGRLAVLNGTLAGHSRDTRGTDEGPNIDIVAAGRDSRGTAAGQPRDSSRARDPLPTITITELQDVPSGTLSNQIPDDPPPDSGWVVTPPDSGPLQIPDDPPPDSGGVPRTDWLEVWGQLQAVRAEHTPHARSQGLTQPRKANLIRRCGELTQAGLTRADLLRAAAWVHESGNVHAEGARATGDPLATLLRPAHCVQYCELARDEEGHGPPPMRTRGPHTETSQERQARRDREVSIRLGMDPDDEEYNGPSTSGKGGGGSSLVALAGGAP